MCSRCVILSRSFKSEQFKHVFYTVVEAKLCSLLTYFTSLKSTRSSRRIHRHAWWSHNGRWIYIGHDDVKGTLTITFKWTHFTCLMLESVNSKISSQCTFTMLSWKNATWTVIIKWGIPHGRRVAIFSTFTRWFYIYNTRLLNVDVTAGSRAFLLGGGGNSSNNAWMIVV